MDRKLEKDRLDVMIGNNIRVEREARNLTRDELAEMMELTTSHMGLIERGERGATAVTMSKLSKVFDIPIDHLFENPKRGGISIKETDANPTHMAGVKKINSLLTNLDTEGLDFIIHTIKGVIAMNRNSK